MTRPPLYTTPALAAEQARDMNVLHHTGHVEVVLLLHVEAVVRDPRSSSDTMLIVADALREAARTWSAVHARAAAFRTLADQLTTLAPTRADAIGEPTA
jgi:hypothetical protein